jgi:hypothetical protein
MVPGNTAISAPILPRGRKLSLGHAQRCNLLIIEQSSSKFAVEILPLKHCDLSTYLSKRARDQFGACAEVQFQDYGTVLWSLAVEMVPVNIAISAPILPKEREVSLEHAQRCSFLILEQRYGPLAVEIVPGRHGDFSTYLAKRARAQSGACAEVQFPDY